MSEGLLGGIEAGGTKFVLTVGESPTRVHAAHTIPTREPSQTLAEARCLGRVRHTLLIVAL